MSKLSEFSFKDEIVKLCPMDDFEKSREHLETSVQDTIKADKVTGEESTKRFNETYGVFSRTLDTLFMIFKRPTLHEEDDCVDSIISILESLKLYWSIPRKTMEVYSGYTLNLDSIPTAILFYKHLLETQWITRITRCTRASLENEFKIWNGRAYSHTFSHVLFSLSWLGLLRVHNTSTVLVNQTPPIMF